jgi:hypothetical protein
MHRYRALCTTEKTMKQSAKRLTLAASAFAFAALFSFSWSEQSGVAFEDMPEEMIAPRVS